MRIFNENKTQELLRENCDSTKGKFESDTLTTHIVGQQEVKEQWHYETIREYSNGGKDIKKVIDVKYQPFIAEHDETEKILVYKSYTEDELKVMEIQRRIGDLKQKLADTDYKAIKYAEGELMAEEYEETKIQRRTWREKINKLEEELK